MALTDLQRTICRLIADNRIASGESASRISRDIDLFHDTDEALDASWRADRRLLEGHGFSVALVRERRSFVEAEVGRQGDYVRMEWARDSSFRFFPLVRHPDLGLTLHPFDLATNKVLALVGRLEVRDWIDVITSDQKIQPLGYLAWAASGKDPGFSPRSILEEAARTGRYSAADVGQLAFADESPDAAALSRTWRAMLSEAADITDALPPENVGTCVLTDTGELCRATAADLHVWVEQHKVAFHAGSIRGVLPAIRG